MWISSFANFFRNISCKGNRLKSGVKTPIRMLEHPSASSPIEATSRFRAGLGYDKPYLMLQKQMLSMIGATVARPGGLLLAQLSPPPNARGKRKPRPSPIQARVRLLPAAQDTDTANLYSRSGQNRGTPVWIAVWILSRS